MLRTTLTICLLFSFSALGIADDNQPKPLPIPPADEVVELPADLFGGSILNSSGVEFGLKTDKPNAGKKLIDSKIAPAVHVNSTGVESNYSSRRRKNGAVNRLRNIRRTEIEKNSMAKKVVPGKKSLDGKGPQKTSAEATTSRRPQKIEVQDDQPTAPKKLTGASKVNTAVRPDAKVSTPANVEAPKPVAQAKVDPLPSVVTRRGLAEPTLALPKPAKPADLPSPITPIVTEPAPGIAATVESQPTPRVASRTPIKPGVTSTPAPIKPQVTPPAVTRTKQPVMRTDSFNQATMSTANQLRKSETKRPVGISATRPQPRRNDVLLSNRSPVLVVKTHGQTKIRVGRPATYYVSASNQGDLIAEDVVVKVNVPNWAELTRNQATAGGVKVESDLNGDNVLQWTIRDLKPGSEQRLRIDMVPRASRAIELGVKWNFKSAAALAQIEVEEPKLQLAIVGPGEIRFGDTKHYTITVSNPGTGDAENVVLTLLPVNNNGGTAGERDLGTVKAGTQRSIEVELTARQAGELAIRGHVTGDGGLRADGEQPVRVRRANLVVEAMGPAKRYAGTAARYRLKVTNTGDATASDVVAAANLPMGANFVKCSHNGAFDKNRNLVQWSLGALRPGANQVVEVTTQVNGSGKKRLEARASAKADQLAASATAITEVEALADLRLTVYDPVGPVPLDTEVTYEIRVENRGTKVANDINVVGYFSEGIEPTTVQGWQGEISVGQVVLDTIPSVAPGQRMSIKVKAEASRAGNHVFRAELDSNDPSTKTKLAVEEWTVFHADPEAAPIQQADAQDSFYLER